MGRTLSLNPIISNPCWTTAMGFFSSNAPNFLGGLPCEGFVHLVCFGMLFYFHVISNEGAMMWYSNIIWNQYEINIIYISLYTVYRMMFFRCKHAFFPCLKSGAVRQVWVALPIWPGWWGKPFGKWWGFPHRAVSRVNTKKNHGKTMENLGVGWFWMVFLDGKLGGKMLMS